VWVWEKPDLLAVAMRRAELARRAKMRASKERHDGT
jgi:hypothetical protein